MADYSGKAQFFLAFKCPAEHEADRLFAHHAEWMQRTHPCDGDEALLQYTVSKRLDDEGSVMFLLAEVYETPAGVAYHGRLAHEDDEGSGYALLVAFAEKCETIGWGSSGVVHSLW